MEFELLLKHKHWQGEGRIVRITKFVMYKTPVTNSWIEGIAYEHLNELNNGNTYVRTAIDFLTVFKPYELLSEND